MLGHLSTIMKPLISLTGIIVFKGIIGPYYYGRSDPLRLNWLGPCCILVRTDWRAIKLQRSLCVWILVFFSGKVLSWKPKKDIVRTLCGHISLEIYVGTMSAQCRHNGRTTSHEGYMSAQCRHNVGTMSAQSRHNVRIMSAQHLTKEICRHNARKYPSLVFSSGL